ncbi:phosphatase PAP2 family protein [Reichenbachiella versicolor]|uniref:phosphatase PAP2 family protein n=1 Tax=Reichenbachiella versicolor TaxID=1821036 RepID=UPI0013A57F62|nr:phosphatase PAP2 family protein [Reichenbachiella versicolor]
MKVLGQIQSLKMEERNDRIIPFLFVTGYYGMTAYMFIFQIKANVVVSTIFISSCLMLAILTLITLRHKISIHSAGMSSVTGYIIAFAIEYPNTGIFYPLVAMIVLTGAVISSRLYLNAHRPIEILTGTLVGIIISFTSLTLVI